MSEISNLANKGEEDILQKIINNCEFKNVGPGCDVLDINPYYWTCLPAKMEACQTSIKDGTCHVEQKGEFDQEKCNKLSNNLSTALDDVDDAKTRVNELSQRKVWILIATCTDTAALLAAVYSLYKAVFKIK
eukprot:NODE_440_length_7390_cov_0.787546.p9 type:complete len:132 gc:universal NODE_440_length_7390_cov_0.787546:4671-5066(+)